MARARSLWGPSPLGATRSNPTPSVPTQAVARRGKGSDIAPAILLHDHRACGGEEGGKGTAARRAHEGVGS
eukprot:CAMPEP_0206284368 /NCGR_PEP_ID=MMETSP0047_2-20121206/40734_1 /ASSEMBLY_ACC=CAM_ASM_000192 /TAXON_ID=195065 /ORGANISM="Chroomonas mesostigmatica_cf, Strain CCMP1168" /LENGTH=70 /DNA_ID=CAMNT_0053714811 /DNA_START=324 /DNA_END=537 /DNA_ORIENTATION=-